MSLLSGSLRSDSPAVLNVHGCGVGRSLDGSGKAIVAGFHTRLTGGAARELLAAMERGMKERVPLMARHSEDVTIAGTRLSVHSVGSHQLLYMVVTRADYPRRAVFGRVEPEMEPGFALSLLPKLASETIDQVGLDLAQGSASPSSGKVLRIVKLTSRAQRAMERVCADFESVREVDRITNVQAQVDEVADVMRDNMNQILHNSEQLSMLSDKADMVNMQAGAFKRTARDARRNAQCEDYKSRAVFGGAIASVVFILWWWLF